MSRYAILGAIVGETIDPAAENWPWWKAAAVLAAGAGALYLITRAASRPKLARRGLLMAALAAPGCRTRLEGEEIYISAPSPAGGICYAVPGTDMCESLTTPPPDLLLPPRDLGLDQ